ncbi:hypothetical protein H920_04077 [Fukomys damarensis]|uniref:Uncharacterized protein n=1 Tax=Fukomys damarensis TaxID=885580 RepID=A0A091DVI6_FUKDA|nr:hypothetical protein H920_04077 [Fukomys damarensis]
MSSGGWHDVAKEIRALELMLVNMGANILPASQVPHGRFETVVPGSSGKGSLTDNSAELTTRIHCQPGERAEGETPQRACR